MPTVDSRGSGAPGDQFTLLAFKDGYRQAELTIEPADREAVFKLAVPSPLRILGTVSDAETGQPIETFRVLSRTGPFFVQMAEAAATHVGGRYLFDDVRMVQSYRIRIEAKGYLPVQSPAYPHDGGERVFDARLKRGNWIEGVVRGPDGSPLGEAEVILATGNGIHITGGKEYPTMYYPHVMTGLGGGFAFAPPDGDARVVVLHDRGYAEATLGQLAETHNVRIQPWGRIEGTLRVAGRPLANELIFADVGREPDDPMRLNVHNFNHGKTDQQGRFTIDRLPAGEARVYWQQGRKREQSQPDRYYQPGFVDVLAGKTALLDLVHEGGLPLLGRVVARDRRKRPLGVANTDAFLVPKLPVVAYPPRVSDRRARRVA